MEFIMKKEVGVNAVSQKAVQGRASLLLGNLSPFNGSVERFETDGRDVLVSANQTFDSQRRAVLQILFEADIQNGEHEYTAGGKIWSFIYFLYEKNSDGQEESIPYSAVDDSGSVNVTFDPIAGTFRAVFKLKFQSGTQPPLEANGSFIDVSGLERVAKLAKPAQ